jgi:predicted AAA+ superfamily ATPase
VASFSQGGVLNYTEIAREASIDRQVVMNYFDILEDLLVGVRLSVFTKKAKRRLVRHNKFYYFDVGVYRAIRPVGPLDMPESVTGSAMETLVLQELRAINDALNLEYDIYFWRTSNQVEVDFILYGKKGLIAIEVKSGSRLSSDIFSGLKAFKSDYPMAKCYLVYGGDRREYRPDIDIVGAKEFLQTLPVLLGA